MMNDLGLRGNKIKNDSRWIIKTRLASSPALFFLTRGRFKRSEIYRAECEISPTKKAASAIPRTREGGKILDRSPDRVSLSLSFLLFRLGIAIIG